MNSADIQHRFTFATYGESVDFSLAVCIANSFTFDERVIFERAIFKNLKFKQFKKSPPFLTREDSLFY